MNALKLGAVVLTMVLAVWAVASADDASDRIAWFNDAKFGMFIHWGPFSVQGADPENAFDYFEMKDKAEPRVVFRKYAEGFNPKSFDAKKWMDIAKAGGMKYVVFTSKHHDGYCLFDSRLTDWDSMDMAPKRDYVRELVKAARETDLKIGFYYSMLDWRRPDYFSDINGFVDNYLFGQVRELCSNYGPIDCVWFDGEWDYSADVWRAPELVKMIRELQPKTLVNDRLGKGERGVTPLSDFYTREQPEEVNVAMSFEHQKPYSWEACMTIGDYWQYSLKDVHFKEPSELVRILVDVVSRGGNLLLNVGPTPDGIIPQQLEERVRAVGAWLDDNGESIYGTTRSPFGPLHDAWCAAKGNRLYIHLQKRPDGPVQLPGLKNAIKKAWLLKTSEPLKVDDAAKSIEPPSVLPDVFMTTIAVELDGLPVVEK
jgi:alpha-L-fucosidase